MIFVLAAARFAVIGLALMLFTARSLRSPRGLAAPPRRRVGLQQPDIVRARIGVAPAGPPQQRAPSAVAETVGRQAAVVRSRVAAVAAIGRTVGPLAKRVRATAARASQSWPRLDPEAAPPAPSATMVAIVIGGLALVALFTVLLTRDTGTSADQTTIEATPAPAETASDAPAPTASATAPAAAAFNDDGQPFSGAEIRNSWTARGMTATATEDPVPCQNPTVPPRAYRITRADGTGEQRVALLIYPSAQAMQAQWTTGSSGAQYRGGGCGIGATVIYFNANAILMIFQISDAALRRQVSDAFVGATP